LNKLCISLVVGPGFASCQLCMFSMLMTGSVMSYYGFVVAY